MQDPTRGPGVLDAPLTLTPFIKAYLGERQRKGEIQTGRRGRDYESRLHSLAESFGRRPVNQFTERAIDRWLETIGNLRASSRRAYLSTAKGFARWMVRRGHIKANPTEETARIREPRAVPRALPAEKVAALLASRPDVRDQLILWLMVGLGLRCSEVAGLCVEDFDAHAATLLVRGKSGHERMLPTPAIVAGALNAYLDQQSRFSGPILRSELNPARGVDGNALSKLITEWMYAAGIKHKSHDGISAHALRHTCASDVLDQCGDLRVVQALLGHSNIATTSRYLRIAALHQVRAALEGRTYGVLQAAPLREAAATPDPVGAPSRPCSLREHLDAGGDLSPMLYADGDVDWLAQAVAFDIPLLTAEARLRRAADERAAGELYLEHPNGDQAHVTGAFWMAEMYEDEDLRRRVEELLPSDLVAAESTLRDAWRHPHPITLETINAPSGSWVCGSCGAEAPNEVPAVVVAQNPGSREDSIHLCSGCVQRVVAPVRVG